MIGYFLALWQYLHELHPITGDVRQAFGRLNSRLAEAIDGIETVKGMAQEKQEVERFGDERPPLPGCLCPPGRCRSALHPAAAAGSGGSRRPAAFVAAFPARAAGRRAGGGLFRPDPALRLPYLYLPVCLFTDLAGDCRRAAHPGADQPPERPGPEHARVQSRQMRGEIEFRNVSFATRTASRRWRDISFKVKAGQTVAIVGQTGSGKTTLVKLVNRTYDVTGGQVLVDGVDVRDWNLEALRRSISIIEQDIFLFSR